MKHTFTLVRQFDGDFGCPEEPSTIGCSTHYSYGLAVCGDGLQELFELTGEENELEVVVSDRRLPRSFRMRLTDNHDDDGRALRYVRRYVIVDYEDGLDAKRVLMYRQSHEALRRKVGAGWFYLQVLA